MRVYGTLLYHSDRMNLSIKGYQNIYGMLKKNYGGDVIELTSGEFKKLILDEIKTLQKAIGVRRCTYFFFLFAADGSNSYFES